VLLPIINDPLFFGIPVEPQQNKSDDYYELNGFVFGEFTKNNFYYFGKNLGGGDVMIYFED